MGINCVTVYLKSCNGCVVDTTHSDCNGNYTFSDVAPGTYKVCVPNSICSQIIEPTNPIELDCNNAQTCRDNKFGYKSSCR